ncbi:formate dehydrogenase accessory protein FdhE [Desulfuribacillus alkaliarsenatis]|uniref:FdhE C-terminal domain-containing protein n=1 Tax=Desulfuribacillus alkaliarsenatis TaxID=766136 RepID=A0A1E5FZG5_9FIRM|nr:formate dehydrogenase accessory protein FdhE [Desulfuribacillus alkaliarsenatis]OEF95919.1 hypothetical protein BHF68_11045 [Desulfuribacillus alkaliarsenatis]
MSQVLSAIEKWVEKHPYLDEIANLQKVMVATLEEATHAESMLTGAMFESKEMESELKRGIPALKTISINDAEVEATVVLVRTIAEALSSSSLPTKMNEQCKKIHAIASEEPEIMGGLIKQVLTENEVDLEELTLASVDRGVLMYVIWNALSHVLHPIKTIIDEKLQTSSLKWNKEYCPVCGQLPGMAQLVRTSKGRERNLVCGCCQMQWRYKRMGCPYCKNDKQKTLNIIELEGVKNLRIDTCDKCKGYIKTYTDEGNEQVILSDWSTLHLDLVGKNNGYQRFGYQLYGI